MPSTIPEGSVNISDEEGGGAGGGTGYSGEPSSVTVSGTKITLALYPRFPGAEFSAGTISGRYTVTIKQSAGITNPTSAGKKTINVKDADATDETPSVVIESKVKLSAASGARGTEVTVSGVGLGKGGATAYLVRGCADQGTDGLKVAQQEAKRVELDDAEYELPGGTDCTEENDISLGNGTVSGGKVSVDIDTTSSDFVTGNYAVDKTGKPIWTVRLDSDGEVVRDSAGRVLYDLTPDTFEFAMREDDEEDPDFGPYRPSDSNRGFTGSPSWMVPERMPTSPPTSRLLRRSCRRMRVCSRVTK